jgi:hypothetical protein
MTIEKWGSGAFIDVALHPEESWCAERRFLGGKARCQLARG